MKIQILIFIFCISHINCKAPLDSLRNPAIKYYVSLKVVEENSIEINSAKCQLLEYNEIEYTGYRGLAKFVLELDNTPNSLNVKISISKESYESRTVEVQLSREDSGYQYVRLYRIQG